jgi:hypothetical protein
VAQVPPHFADVTDASGLSFVYEPFEDGSFYLPEQVGGGAALFDYDNDGDLDAYFVNGAPHGISPLRGHAGAAATNRLFRQDLGLKFVDVTDAAGVGDTGFGTGVAVGDYDNDGDADLFVANVGPDVLYRNNGDGTFTDVTAAAGVAGRGWGSSAVFVDYDGDSLLDLYVAQYLRPDPTPECDDPGLPRDYCGPRAYPPEVDVLYHNNGDGTFADVSEAAGIAPAPSYGLGVVAADFTGDDRPDVFVANDNMPNKLWVNRGDGTFEDQAMARGTAVTTGTGKTAAGMGIAAEDLDGDGTIDLFVTHLGNEFHRLRFNDRNESFRDATDSAGLARYWNTGWGTTFFDYDHDGDLDLAYATGRITRIIRRPEPTDDGSAPAAPPPPPPPGSPAYWSQYAEQSVLLQNDGAGRFRGVSPREAGAFATTVHSARGLAWGDVDNDGDVDLLVTAVGEKARLFRNDRGTGRGGHWLLARAVDPRLKRDAIGAVVSLTAGGRTYHRLVAPGRSFASSGDPRVHFGLAAEARVEKIQVRWPDGTRETFPGTTADQIVTLNKGSGAAGAATAPGADRTTGR